MELADEVFQTAILYMSKYLKENLKIMRRLIDFF